MKILVNPIKTKMMPIVAASLLTAGTLTSCSKCLMSPDKSPHLVETVTTLNNDLNYLNSAKKTNKIEFGDYYENSKKLINETELNEEKLKEDSKNDQKSTNALLMFFTIVAGLKTWSMYKSMREEEDLISLPLAITIMSLFALGDSYINKDSNEQIYIQKAQKSLKVYKDEKLATLDTLKIEELNQTPIETSKNKQ